MKSRFISLLIACACTGLAHAQFNPVALTPDSYTFNLVVRAATVQDLTDCINVTAGNGNGLGDNTYYEEGLYARPGEVGGNSGIPIHNTVFDSINNTNLAFLMPPDYTTNNELMIDSTYTTGSLAFATPTAATSLAILSCGGGGAINVTYTVFHNDGTTETGTLSLLDWFAGGSTVAWGANGRVQDNGGYNNFNSSSVNNNPPYLYGNTITISGTAPITNISFSSPSDGNHANIYAISASNGGSIWTPVSVGGFNVRGTVPAAIPFPVTATMDQGTNLNNNGNLATYFEQGYDRTVTGAGLPPSGTSFQSVSQPSHTYQMGDYSTNCATLIDTNHQIANIAFAAPAAYFGLSFLTSGGDIGAGNIMTNICIIQHRDGVQETNLFFGYDWFDQGRPGALALEADGRLNLYNRTLNNVGNQGLPYLFESYFTLNDTTSPVTNIVVKYSTAPSASATTFIMAVSASSAGVPPLVSSGPIPGTVTLIPGGTTNFTVGLSGNLPITGFWQVDNGGTWFNLSDGLDAHGSTISGSQTTTLTISNVFEADGTNYQFVANNAYGTADSLPATLIVSPQSVTISPAAPAYNTSNNILLTATVAAGPKVGLQWYFIDTSGTGTSNLIAGATNSTYLIQSAPLSFNGYAYGVIATNIYGTNTAEVTLSISDAAASLVTDLTPLNAEAYAGTPVTYAVTAAGNSPINYQWIINGAVVSGATNASYTLATPCGATTVQAAFSNALSGGVVIMTTQVTLHGDGNPPNITFAGNGTGWVTNGDGSGTVPNFTNSVLELTDGGGGEGSSAYYGVAQYVGGSWTASYTYNSHAGSADGSAFVFQNFTNGAALGGSGGQLGYGGVTNSFAFEINLYNGNGETPGIAQVINGQTGVYHAVTPVDVNSSDDIDVVLIFTNGVLSASLTDTTTLATYSTNYTVGSLTPILGGDLAYVGFSGGDGGATSTQTINNFQFHSLIGAGGAGTASLSVKEGPNNTIIISWPVADSGYELQVSSSLSSPSWVNGPAATTVGANNQVTITTGVGQAFYRLAHSACP